MKTIKSRTHSAAIALAALSAPAFADAPASQAFTYQGELKANGAAVSGRVDLRFILSDSADGDTQLGATLCFNDVMVNGGRFTQTLDFGDQFTGGQRYLRVFVRPDPQGVYACDAAAPFSEVTPRAMVTASPSANYALLTAAAAHAQNASAATTAQNTLALGGKDSAHYLDGASVSGTLPGASLSGTYTSAVTMTNPANQLGGDGSGITGVSHVVNAAAATSATTATSAQNASNLGGQPVARQRSLSSFSGVLPSAALTGTYNYRYVFDNASNVYYGNGGGLSLSAGNFVSGTIGDAQLASGTDSSAVTFSNSQNVYWGNGTGLTGLKTANLTAGVFPSSAIDAQFTSAGTQSVGTVFFMSGLTEPAIPNSTVTINAPYDGNAVLNWSVTGFCDADQTCFYIRPILDSNFNSTPPSWTFWQKWFFNQGNVHKGVSGTMTIPLTAGQHTIQLAVSRRTMNGGNIHFDQNDSVQVSVMMVR